MYILRRTLIGVLFLLVGLSLAMTVQAKELRWAFQGEIHSMDPYSLNESFSLGTHGNVYEALVRRAPNLKIGPALAESWKLVEPTRWRFKLRKGVKFHEGEDFTADDVVFSFHRARAEGSDVKTKLATVKEIVKVDSHTVDFITKSPNPILTSEMATWFIMSKSWAEKNGATKPESAAGKGESYSRRHANGTGPFKLVSREADVKTVFEVNKNWWDTATHNVTRVVFTPIGSDATRVAALLSGNVDMVYPIPVQDMRRVRSGQSTDMLVGPELRTIYFAFDVFRDELLHSSVKGKNPFKDKRVRQAFYQAIDIKAIQKKVMRGLSTPTAMMVGPGIIGHNTKFKRLPYNPANSKKLLAAAGYPNGFEVTLDCPNNRYVNDEGICQAAVGMLAKIGIKINLLAQPKSIYFGKVLAPKLDTSFYLIGWTPDSFDSHNPLFNLLNCADDSGKGKFNLGRYCNPKVDELTAKILSETNADKRNAMLEQAWGLVLDDIPTLPLHQQAVAWGVSTKIKVAQRADNVFHWRHVTVK